jgi:SAM-dependent methyltransferase
MLPSLYHAHHNRHLEDLPFWLKLAQRQGGPVLELGCGTGRILIPLAEAGYEMIGLDNDPEMLDFLRAQMPPELQPRPQVVIADMTAFELGRRFPLVILPCNTWSVLEPPARRAALACIVRHLAPGGIFATSVPSPDMLRDLPARSAPELEEEFEHPPSGGMVQVSSGWRRAKGHLTVTWHYDLLLPDGTIERSTLQARHTLSTVQEYLEELDEVGLAVEAVYGDFEETPYGYDSDDLIMMAGRLLANL